MLNLNAMKSVPTEDTIVALLDYFVSPLLSVGESRGKSLSDHQQTLIAKQLNAVVVLYNYYHRKQFPDLEFLDFKSFLKISCISKPNLLPYLRFMHRCEEDSGSVNNQYSITEKKVIDACDLCLKLDSCKENPVMDAWPVSKVAVFLVDSKKEKCALLYSHLTQGVWSVVEKELTGPDNKFLQIESCESEKILEELAFSAVETDTGISFKNLLILEHHLTYSLSYEKTSALLYIMKYEGELSNGITEVFIEDVKTSLEGPIVQKDLTCEVTPLVEYYGILPYYEAISNWFSREKKGKQVDACENVCLDFTEDHNPENKHINPSKNGTIIETDEKTPSPLDTEADIEVNGLDTLNAEKDISTSIVVLPKEENNAIKRRKLLETVPTSRSSCQELDDICHRNSWTLPRYIVIPYFDEHDTTGGFKATVELHSIDFDFKSDGEKKASPSEARESAASHILSKLRTQESENQ